MSELVSVWFDRRTFNRYMEGEEVEVPSVVDEDGVVNYTLNLHIPLSHVLEIYEHMDHHELRIRKSGPIKGVLNTELVLLDIDKINVQEGHVREIEEEDVFVFEKGSEVEVLKVITDKSYMGGTAYVILNDKQESLTVSSALVDLTDIK